MAGKANKSEVQNVVITRSSRRQKSVGAKLSADGTTVEITAPIQMTEAELAPVIEKLKMRLLKRVEKRDTADDASLQRRAAELNRQVFGGRLKWAEIRYVGNQNHRYGSCTPSTKTIRISHRVASMPTFVQDYVIVHELAHLEEANHGPRFWKLVNKYPKAERARGYLMALGMETEEPDAGDLVPEG